MSAAQQNGSIKPSLHGVKIKQRKGQQKAQAKHEPTVFRDNIIKILLNAKRGDFDEISQQLDIAGNTLEYKKYGETLFEILLIGGVLAPGGTVLDDGAPKSPFSIFSAENNIENIKKHVEVFNKLIRRYLYLQHIFEDKIKNMLQYINKWTTEENNKLATAIGLFASGQLISISVLDALFSEHLVKEGHSLQFITTVFKAFLGEQSMDHLGISLKKANIDHKLIDFFPPKKRDKEFFARYFEAEDMKQFVGFFNQRLKNSMKDNTIDHVKEMIDSSNTSSEIISYLKQQMKQGGWQETDFVQIVWESLLQAVDWSTRPEQIGTQATNQVKQFSSVLSEFANNPKTELSLLQKIQNYCYENTKLLKHFCKIIRILYDEDVVSENAILYWNEKGATNQGKTSFLKQMEPFIQWLKTVESESEEE